MSLISPRVIIRRATLQEIVELRHLVLRAGLPRETAIFAGDELASTRHFAAISLNHADDSQRVVGCCTVHLKEWQGRSAWQLRGMATADDFRGQGLGRRMLQWAEKALLDEAGSPRLFWCNARTPAVGFYRRMGWEVVSEEFEIATAGPHVKMLRELPAAG